MFENYDLSKRYLVACSGGPDSMALLDMLYKNKFNLVVCNVNYKTRKESDYEEKLVKDYCNKRNIECYVAIYKDDKSDDSFEVKARHFRYNFFAKIYNELNLNGLFVAHHKDDLIETYLLKKQRNVINESYIINEKSIINKMIVLRPLLKNFYKNDLLDYCNNNHIEYSIDYTNLLPVYPRNAIRIKLQNMDKEAIYNEALKEEELLQNTKKNVHKFIRYYPVYECSILKEKNELFLSLFLHELIDAKYKQKVNHSLYLKLVDFINSNKPNLIYKIDKNYYLVKEYNLISFEKIKIENYEYKLEKFKLFSTPYFKIVNDGLKMQGIYLEESDYPIIIRNYHDDDKIKLKEGTKKVSRLLIDKKVPLKDRYTLPVIENSNHEIVFVYGLYRKYGLKYVKNNLFMVK